MCFFVNSSKNLEKSHKSAGRCFAAADLLDFFSPYLIGRSGAQGFKSQQVSTSYVDSNSIRGFDT
jgi:hypothetical protein